VHSFVNLESSAATSYERGEKQNENFKSNHDRRRLGRRLKLGRLRPKEGDRGHGYVGRLNPNLLEVNSFPRIRVREALT
jgi:hypothetical protein